MTPTRTSHEAAQLRSRESSLPGSAEGNGLTGLPWDPTAPTEELTLDADAHPAENAAALGRALARSDDLYAGRDELVGVSRSDGEAFRVSDGKDLGRLLLDRVRITIVRGQEKKAGLPPLSFLNIVLGTRMFLDNFRPVDLVTARPLYLPDFTLTTPGYNDGGPGHRIVYTGPEPQPSDGLSSSNRFLDVMAFASAADRANAVALALTVLLRNHWAGDKPAGIITATKSHAGKDTVVAFAAGRTPKISVDYETADWALRQALVAVLQGNPGLGVINVKNVRKGHRDRFIASAAVERFLTDPEPSLYSSKSRAPLRIRNHLVLTITTNDGTVSQDLMNRGLPIHLTPVGNVADRESPIGNPKQEYLPAHRLDIEAELLGMVERWKAAGRPLDQDVRHPFTDWARTVGGILRVSGFQDFLGNYAVRRTVDDPVRAALGLLGAAKPDEWLRPGDWAKIAAGTGLTRSVIPEADRDSDEGRRRGIGVVLSAHCEETFVTVTDDERLTLRLEKARKRVPAGAEPGTCYRFVVLSREPLPFEDK
jgi:hypothetical protein